MKHELFTLAFATLCLFSYGQNNIGIGTPSPDASSLLELSAQDKGFLVPRLTQAQRQAILSPATGLLVFDLTASCFYYYDGATWLSLCNQPGTQGPTGAQGDTGPKGDKGDTGAQGIGSICATAAANNIALFSTSSELCNSVLYQSGNKVGLNTSTPAVSFDVSAENDGIAFPNGNTAQRPAGATAGTMRWNSTLSSMEVYDGSKWLNINTPPIGSTYIQWMNASEPNTIYPGTTWIKSDIQNGEFIRAVGGAANVGASAALTGTLQTDAVKDHMHTATGTAAGAGTLTTSSAGAHSHTGTTSGANPFTANRWIPYDDNLSSNTRNLSMDDNPTTCGTAWDNRHTVGNFMGKLDDNCIGHNHTFTTASDGVHTHTIPDHTHTLSITVNNGGGGTETRPANVAVIFWRRTN